MLNISLCNMKDMKTIDLTMSVSPRLKVFRGSPSPSFITWSKLDTHGYSSEVVFMSTHTGTHVDAASHFVSGSPSIDEFPVYRFIRSAVLLQIPRKENQPIQIEDIATEYITKNDTVVFSTGWERQTKSDKYVTANPGLAKDAAKYLAKKEINAVAIDGPSIDAGADSSFPSHHILKKIF